MMSNTRSTNIFMTSSDVPLAYLGYIYFLITQSILVLTLYRSAHIFLYSILRQVKSCIFNPEIILISVLPITTLSCLLKITSYIHSFICITFRIFQSKYASIGTFDILILLGNLQSLLINLNIELYD